MNFKFAISNLGKSDNIRKLMKKTGRTASGHLLWTKHEDEIVRRFYPDYKKLEYLLKHRTPTAIKARCATLNLHRPPVFTSKDVVLLRGLWGVASKQEILAAFPNHTWKKLYDCARRNRLQPKRTGYKPTGDDLLDSLRKRAFYLNLSMPDLDAMARTNGYFQFCRWVGHKRVSRAAVIKAIYAIGGRIQAVWDDPE